MSDPSNSSDRGIREVGWQFRDRIEKLKFFIDGQWIYNNESKGVVPRYLDKIGVLKFTGAEMGHKKFMTIEHLDKNRPVAFHKHYQLSNAIMIRSYNSKDLPKNTNIV